MVYRMQLTYDENIGFSNLEFIPTKRTGLSLNPGIYEITDKNTTLQLILPDNVKVTVTIDNPRIKSKLKIEQNLIFTDKIFFHTLLGLTRSLSYALNDIDGFYQLIAGSYKSNEAINFTAIDKVLLKSDCINLSIVNGVREPISYSSALFSLPDHKLYNQTRIELF